MEAGVGNLSVGVREVRDNGSGSSNTAKRTNQPLFGQISQRTRFDSLSFL